MRRAKPPSTERRLQAALGAVIVLVAACGEPGLTERADERPLFVYISPDPLGVNDFLVMGKTGLERAAERHGARALVLESEDPTSRAENVRAAIDDGADVVVVLGFEFGDILSRAARDAPDVQFLIVDQCIDDPPPNVRCAVFREQEAAFLIGAAAALVSESGRVGVIGALDIPFLHRYTDAFAQGARHVDPEVEVSTLWIGGEQPFADPVRAKEQSLALAARGVDPIFAAASASNFGVFEAAQERGFRVFGLDSDQCPAAPEVVIDSLMKRVDQVIVAAIDQLLDGTAEPLSLHTLANGGLALRALGDDLAASQCRIREHPEAVEILRALAAEISAGEIDIPDPMGLGP